MREVLFSNNFPMSDEVSNPQMDAPKIVQSNWMLVMAFI